MRHAILAMALVAGCSSHDPPGGGCDGCSGGPDFAGADLSAFDFSLSDLSEPWTDLAVGDLSGADDLAGPPAPCPVVALLLDTSGSMDLDFTGGTTPRITAARTALSTVIDNYGGHVPLAFSHFDTMGACNAGVVTPFAPMIGNQTALKGALPNMSGGGVANTGDAINALLADANIHVPGAVIVLLTDGAANCEATDPGFSAGAADTAARATPSLPTYVVALDVAAMSPGDLTQMETLAVNGKRPCASGFCNKKSYYPTTDPTRLAKALDLVMSDILGRTPGCGGFGCFPSGAACAAGTTCCGTDGCKNLTNDSDNCGACGTVCTGGAVCSGSVCKCGGVQCPAGDQCCSGTCCSFLDMRPLDM